MSNKKAIKAQERRIKLLREQKEHAEELLKNRKEINDLEYEINKSEEERDRLLRSPIDEHSSKIKITVENNFSKDVNKLVKKIGKPTKDLGDKYRCDIDGSGKDKELENPIIFVSPGEVIARITPENIGVYPLTISGYFKMPTDAEVSAAAFNDVKAEEYDCFAAEAGRKLGEHSVNWMQKLFNKYNELDL